MTSTRFNLKRDITNTTIGVVATNITNPIHHCQ